MTKTQTVFLSSQDIIIDYFIVSERNVVRQSDLSQQMSIACHLQRK